ncbi:hypothetical protein ALC56_05148 [Trachymyrmex septentrionalis]|uniref:Uncharacterized protein n=1 Tax=Trachymyrmex septentrionalis TaxID=34720 RepID=A0A195FJM6_9HYME|nr:hypothetical protein ALC56_05148 [Trachymyrmex septentrionalis]
MHHTQPLSVSSDRSYTRYRLIVRMYPTPTTASQNCQEFSDYVRRRCEKEVGGKLERERERDGEDEAQEKRRERVLLSVDLCVVAWPTWRLALRAPAGPPWPNVRRIVSHLLWHCVIANRLSVIFHNVAVKKKEKILFVACLHHFSLARLKRTSFHLTISKRRQLLFSPIKQSIKFMTTSFVFENWRTSMHSLYETLSSHTSHIDTVEQLLVPARVCRRRLHGVQIWQPYWTVVYPSSHQESLTPTLCIRVSRDVSHDALTRRSPVHCVGILRARAFIVRGSTRGALHN